MPKSPRPSTPAVQQDGLAALFIDYENLHLHLASRLNDHSAPDERILDLLDGLRRHLMDVCATRPVLTLAYADFDALGGDSALVQRALYVQEAEPRFVPATLQANAAELQLCVDAMDVLHGRPDVDTLVVLTGNRAYLPLVQQYRRYGRRVLVVSLDVPADVETTGYRDVFVDATRFLGEAPRRSYLRERAAADHNGTAHNGTAHSSTAHSSTAHSSTAPAAPLAPTPAYADVQDPILLRTIEIIEEFFGQYEEVYLTPLLRKLSEILDERQHDPKVLVSSLEQAGAVRLEKRRGFPYDYTVLIVDSEHPDVRCVQEAFDERTRTDDAETYYDDDEYDDEYDEYDYEDDASDETNETDETDAVARVTGEDVVDHDDYDDVEWDEQVR